MKILISPAKKMRTDTDTLSPQALPAFLPETERLLHSAFPVPAGAEAAVAVQRCHH